MRLAGYRLKNAFRYLFICSSTLLSLLEAGVTKGVGKKVNK